MAFSVTFAKGGIFSGLDIIFLLLGIIMIAFVTDNLQKNYIYLLDSQDDIEAARAGLETKVAIRTQELKNLSEGLQKQVNVRTKELKEQIVCVIPSPSYPNKYFDSRIKYVKNHNNFNRFKYWAYVIDTLIKVLKLHQKHQFDALILRIGQTPIVPLVLSFLIKVPLIFKTLAKYSSYSGKLSWKGKIFNNFWLPLFKTIINFLSISPLKKGIKKGCSISFVY